MIDSIKTLCNEATVSQRHAQMLLGYRLDDDITIMVVKSSPTSF